MSNAFVGNSAPDYSSLGGSTVPIGSVTGLGTGVGTALGINVGSAGAPVVQNGALGTPSSGMLSSCTSLPISTGVSGLGAGVATALAIAPNAASGFPALTAAGKYPALDGSLITNLASGGMTPSTTIELIDEFIGAGNITLSTSIAEPPFGLTGFTSNSGTQTATVLSDNSCGVIDLQTVTSTNSTAGLMASSGAFDIIFGKGVTTIEWRVQVSALSDGTNTYVVRVGAIDTTTGNPVDGVFFRYTHSVNSAHWECVARNNNAETVANASVGPAAGTWTVLKIIVNAAGTSADFYVDGANVGTVASNIPTTTARVTGLGASMVRSAGTAAVHTYLDYCYFKLVFTTPR
jgi:hypothetical protein